MGPFSLFIYLHPGIRGHSENKLLDGYAAKLVHPRDHTKREQGKWTSLHDHGRNQPSYEYGVSSARGLSKQRDWSGKERPCEKPAG
jgi:hypothetical protein